MRTVTYSEVRRHLARVLDRVVDDAEEVVVTRSGREAAVIISLREYESLKETAYLMASPANARRLNEAIDHHLLRRVNALIEDIRRNGHQGIGKPEQLRGNWSGFWSRRIDQEHRLVYRIVDDTVQTAQCRYRYE